MSSFEARKGKSGAVGDLSRRGVLRCLAAATIAAPLLAACGNSGFRPLYGPAELGGAQHKLAKTEIAPIPGRVGQRVRNELIFETTGGAGQVENADYRLEIALRETVTSTLVRISGESLGTVYSLDANFRLIRKADKSVVFEGNSHSRAPFERFNSIFANVRAREDAENRAAQTVGTEIKSRLAAYLSSAT